MRQLASAHAFGANDPSFSKLESCYSNASHRHVGYSVRAALIDHVRLLNGRRSWLGGHYTNCLSSPQDRGHSAVLLDVILHLVTRYSKSLPPVEQDAHWNRPRQECNMN